MSDVRRCQYAAVLSFSVLACVGAPEASNHSVAERLSPWVLERAPGTLPIRLDVDFDGKVTLLGCKVEPSVTVKPGGRVKVTSYWQSREKLEDGWSLFTHVIDGAGQRLLNVDNLGPLREQVSGKQILGPSAWVAGKVYVDQQEITLPTTLRTDTIQIVSGIWKGNRRLRVRSGAHDQENRALLVKLDTGMVRESLAKVPSLVVNKLIPGLKVNIDGKLDEDAWSTWAAFTGPFREVSTGEPNGSSDLGGSARLLWDDTALYIGISVIDTTVTGGFDPHSTDPHLWTRDTAEIMIDPDGDGDNRDYYEIQINPQNLVFDSRFDEYNRPKVDPDGPFGHQDWSSQRVSVVRVEGTLDQSGDRDQGYVVEAKIPWKAFDRAHQIPPKLGDQWRINFYAMENNSGVAWSPILGQGNFHKASRFGRVIWGEKGWSPPVASASGSATGVPTLGSAPRPAIVVKKLPPKPAATPAASASSE